MFTEQSSPPTNFHGTSQRGRLTGALLPEHVSVDERTLEELLAYAAQYARKIKYYNLDGQAKDPETGEDLNWSSFFEKDETVFLATLLATDIHGADSEIQNGFLQIHNLRGRVERVANFTELIEKLLEQNNRLYGWFRKAEQMRDSETMGQIAREITRAMLGELGYQLHGFAQVVEQLGKTGQFPKAETWTASIRVWTTQWPRKPEDRPEVFPDEVEESFDDLLHYSGSRLQDYYRRLYFTLSFLDEITPDLFARSLTHKHDHSPDIGLLITFLRLFAHAQAELNKLSGRHLNYYEKNVLGRVARPATPDRAVVSFLSGNPLAGIEIPAGTPLLAGVNSDGFPSLYRTSSDLYVSQARVAALQTLFVSKNPLVSTNSSFQLVTAVYAAPVANSADGAGSDFIGTDNSWPVLGEDQFDLGTDDRQMKDSTLGFAFASSIFQLTGGERKVNVGMRFTPASFQTLTLLLEDIAENTGSDTHPGDVFGQVFNNPFRIFLTEEEGWLPIEKYLIEPPQPGRSGEPMLSLQFILPASAPSVSAYDVGVHGGHFTTNWPILKLLLSDEESLYPYSFLRDLELEDITIEVAVSGVRELGVHNDLGLLDASRPFVPFGPLPRRGSYMLVGHPELFSKELTELDIDIEWGELPDHPGGFAEHYDDYGKELDNDSFKFTLSALSDYAFQPLRKEEREEFPLFSTELAAATPLRENRSIQLTGDSLKRLRMRPLYGQTELEEFSTATRTGYLRFELSSPRFAFGHSLYPRLFAQRLAENGRPKPFSLIREEAEETELPNEPYTPVINRIDVSYKAKTVINLRPTELKENNAEADDRLFRLHPFGTETVYAAGKLTTPFLLPRFDDDGYLYIGLSELHTARPVSLYFDIEDSKKKISHRPHSLNWCYLNGDEWSPFGKDQILSDTTVLLSTRGVVQLYCPPDMTRGSRLMGADYYWLRISATGNLDVTGRCRAVIPHVVEAVWEDNGDTNHLTLSPAERPKITIPQTEIPGLAGIQQISPFYGGRAAEDEEAFYVRGSERLRHKNRAVNVWDYERLVLERFPGIQQVKCIGRSGYEDLLPGVGQVLLVVVPHITENNVRPKVGFHVLNDIERYLCEVCGPYARFRVINPIYESLKINCSIKLRDQSIHQQGQVWKEIHSAVLDFMCPWLRSGTLKLGGSISKTQLLALINENPHVAFTTAFSVVHVFDATEDERVIRDTAVPSVNSEILTPSRPWSVLVPVVEHDIDILEEDAYRSAEVTAIDGMQLGADFIITETEEGAFDLSDRGRGTKRDHFFELPTDWLTGE